METSQARYDRIRATLPSARTDADLAWANAWTRQRDAERHATEAAMLAERDKEYNAFLSRFEPKIRARVHSALSAAWDSRTRREYVEGIIKVGGKVQTHPKYGRILSRPDGAFVEQARLTKAAIDYAEYLSTQS